MLYLISTVLPLFYLLLFILLRVVAVCHVNSREWHCWRLRNLSTRHKAADTCQMPLVPGCLIAEFLVVVDLLSRFADSCRPIKLHVVYWLPAFFKSTLFSVFGFFEYNPVILESLNICSLITFFFLKIFVELKGSLPPARKYMPEANSKTQLSN